MRIVLGGIAIDRAIVPHPLLGEAHVIEHAGHAITAMSVIDWDRPTQIPTLAEPGKLPPGAGGALINHIARLAERAGVAALRYAGPYPTHALFRALLRSFRTTADEAVFTADVLGRALRLARDEIAIDFVPAPHERIEITRGFVELRGEIDRVVIDGIAFEPDGSPGRLLRSAAGWAAEIWFGDSVYARIAELDHGGALTAAPHAPPPITSAVVGQAFPPELRAALAELVADAVTAPLAADARAVVSSRPLAWADLGGRAARRTTAGFEVHAALWERIAPLGLPRLVLSLTEALAPVVTQAILADIVRG